jgi:hypothetical protein
MSSTPSFTGSKPLLRLRCQPARVAPSSSAASPPLPTPARNTSTPPCTVCFMCLRAACRGAGGAPPPQFSGHPPFFLPVPACLAPGLPGSLWLSPCHLSLVNAPRAGGVLSAGGTAVTGGSVGSVGRRCMEGRGDRAWKGARQGGSAATVAVAGHGRSAGAPAGTRGQAGGRGGGVRRVIPRPAPRWPSR